MPPVARFPSNLNTYAYLGSGNRNSVTAYVEGEWVAGDSYNLQNEPGTTFVFTEIEGVLQVV